jgi:hypothetical protein
MGSGVCQRSCRGDYGGTEGSGYTDGKSGTPRYNQTAGQGAMLSDHQIETVWESMLSAEIRALYFADLASRYTRQKQIITGISFFLSSGAAATVIAQSPSWIPAALAIIAAAANAYSIAVSLDRKIGIMAKLHSAWNRIATDYERLWNHTYDPDAEAKLDEILSQEKEPSELAATDAPNNQKLMSKWQDYVFSMYHLTNQHG